MSKRLALVLRGISFDENFKHICMLRNNIVNYKYTIDNFNKYIINPLSKIFDIDIFFITYNTEKTADIINDYKPKDYILIEDTDEWYSNNYIVKYGGGTLLQYFSSTQKAILKKVVSYEKKNNFLYDQILITRFDLFFIKDITSYILDFDKFNFVCYGEGYWHHATYDNFYLFNRKYLNGYCKSLDEIFYNNLSSHYLYNMLYIKIGKENISFLFKDGIINEQHKKIINKFYTIHPSHINDGMKQFGNGHEIVEKNEPSWLFDKSFTPTDYYSHAQNVERYFILLKNNFAEYCNRMKF